MRTKWMLCAAVLFLLSAAVATAQTPGNAAPVAEKDSQPTGEPTYEGRVEGDTIENPFVIDDLPFVGSGDTCPFLHDYDEVCPYTGSAAPDVVYSYYCEYDRTVASICALRSTTQRSSSTRTSTSPGIPSPATTTIPGVGRTAISPGWGWDSSRGTPTT